jgi:superfamily II DNA helicase RecQ
LVRIIHDECYTIMDNTLDFRPKIRQLGELVIREVQIVFLTAILLPRIKAEFIRIIKIRPEDIQIFRVPITRPNIIYSMFEYNPNINEIETVY